MLRGFVTNLGAYTEGTLVGKWVEFPTTETLEEVLEDIGSPEEYFFTDYDNDIDLDLGEFEDFNRLNDLAERLEGVDTDLIAAYIEYTGGDIEDALDHIDNVVWYPGYTLEDVAYEIAHDCYNIPEEIEAYFDYKKFARDLQYDGYYETVKGVICC